MFRIVLDDISVLRDSIDAISAFINEGTFTINSNGLVLKAMDPASVVLVNLNILSSAFTEFKSEKESKVSVNIPYLVSILKRSAGNDRVVVELDDSSKQLKILMIGDSNRTFTLPLIDLPESEQKVPNLSFEARAELDAGIIRDGARDALMVSDSVILKAGPDNFGLVGIGDSSQVKLELAKDSPGLHKIECSKDVKSKYSLEYLDKMMKATKIANKICLSFSNDYPLRMDFNVIDKVQLSFILAPRVDVE